MITKKLSKWEEFTHTINEIREKYGSYGSGKKRFNNVILWRGQANYNWLLKTT